MQLKRFKVNWLERINSISHFLRQEISLLFTVEEERAQFRRICLFTLDSTQEVYIPSDSQESSLQIYRQIFSLEVKMVEILTDLNLK